MKRWIMIVLVVGIAAAAAGGVWLSRKKNSIPAYRLARVERGDLTQIVRATGVVQPVKQVLVGTQVNGPIKKLNVDFNDRVHVGDVVAQIDPAVYEARLAQDDANLQQSLASAEQAQARLDQAEKELVRARELTRRDLAAQSDLDTAVATRDVCAAQLKLAQAAITQARASLRLAKINLDYTTICSPVDGVVVDRNVSEGQTVVASMTAQTIFTIASDLREVQLEASIAEADIGKIRVDQQVVFTVDAYDEEFKGTVSQVRLAAAKVQNVVTYPVIVRAANPDERLFPGMTANISFRVAHRQDALKVPNASLRFKPEAVAPASDVKPGPKVWVLDAARKVPVPVPVRIGIGDGSFTEVLEAKNLTAGQDVIVGLAVVGAKSDKTVNPFTPTMPGGRRPR
jgi:HlyD family secretion protein